MRLSLFIWELVSVSWELAVAPKPKTIRGARFTAVSLAAARIAVS